MVQLWDNKFATEKDLFRDHEQADYEFIVNERLNWIEKFVEQLLLWVSLQHNEIQALFFIVIFLSQKNSWKAYSWIAEYLNLFSEFSVSQLCWNNGFNVNSFSFLKVVRFKSTWTLYINFEKIIQLLVIIVVIKI